MRATRSGQVLPGATITLVNENRLLQQKRRSRAPRGDYGNAPRNVVRKPGVNNANFAVFKTVSLRGSRTAQFRCEVYNLFNQVEFQDIDRTARLDASGNQINPNFGTAVGISSPTRPPRVIQLSARFNF